MESYQAEYDKNSVLSDTFWRTPQRAIPGRPLQRVEKNEVMSGSSYQQFQASVNDAWDLGDDDIISGIAEAKISKAISETAALNVINSHRNSTKNVNKSDVKVESENIKPKEEALAVRKNEIRRTGGAVGSSTGLIRHYPGRPRPVRLSALASREESSESKLERFQQILESPVLDLDELKQLSWSGIPIKTRAVTWRLLAGYLPANAERRAETLERKRADYKHLVRQYYDAEREEDTYRQIHIDIPRMSPLVALFQQITVQVMFERILYIWAIRHPASGYVQGINDLVTPFFMVFLQEAAPGKELDNFPLDELTQEQRDIIEADSFWCLSKFLDSIQDNYIFAQLGIQYKVNQLKELIRRIDQQLHEHLQTHGVDYLQFSFRWMNNLLTREIPLPCTIRLWDTYLAESDGFATFQLYVCAAFLLHWREKLMLEKDFQGLMILLQNVPTQNWTDSNISLLVAEAYRLKFAFADAPNHLHNAAKSDR
ncbi:PREDICTED: TBC1 domain family member 22B [Papilio xuthus]|uniref:TBC1 domain family member 22B n=2 Tax=Obtectomera TaxID=104431 RepID=A0A194Q0C7_PAPXU|nr:PREDICTED: TBC1 domain family member 22B [Papilio xuthus]KPI99011.1 TBC1 domain family member 22B [Papilio xuthus]